MPDTELESRSFEKNLTRDAERGLILRDGKRIISFRVTTFQSMVKRLTGIAGAIVARTLLFQLGNEIGHTGLRYSRDKILANNNAEVLDSVIRLHGWGRCLGLDTRRETDSVYTFKMADCPLCFELKEPAPACDLMRGIVTGWMEAFLDKKVIKSVETECAAVRGALCVFEVTFPNDELDQSAT